jgi:hypothetical protein
MSEARAYARFQLRQLIRSWDWFWLILVVVYTFFFGHSLETVPFVLFFLFMAAHLKEAPRMGATGFSSMQAYLVSRPVSRRKVRRWLKSADFIWVFVIVAAAGLGLWYHGAEPSNPSELVCEAPPLPSGTYYLALVVMGALSAFSVAEVLRPLSTVSRKHRTLADLLFVVLGWAAYFGTVLLYILASQEVVDPASFASPFVLWSAAAVTVFFLVHSYRIWRRYDFAASPSHSGWWAHGAWRFDGAGQPRGAKPGRGLRGLMSPLYVYPALIWFAWTTFGWLLTARGGRPVWELLGFFGIVFQIMPICLIFTYTTIHFYTKAQTSAYLLSRPKTRASLVRTNSRAFGLSGLVVLVVLLVVGWYLDGHLGLGALFLPWMWLLFLYTGTIAMTWGLSSPTFNSPLGLLGGIILICAAAMAILLDEPPESWSTPLAAVVCVATPFALGAIVVIVADRHVRSADIG